MKPYVSDLYKLLNLLKAGEPFAYNRFSDGELYILQDKEVILDTKQVKIGQLVSDGRYQQEDHKHFHPEEHSFYRDRLIEAFRFEKHNYFRGLCCRCCVGEEDYKWQMDFLNLKNPDPNITWASLLVNANYPRYIREVYPVFNNYKTVFVCHEKADLSVMPFLVKDFRVGYNAMVNDYGMIETLKNWIDENDIQGHLFLFSAAAFSKMAIHQLYQHNDKNTYFDVGTTLNPFMNMRLDRTYLREFWLGGRTTDINKICIR